MKKIIFFLIFLLFVVGCATYTIEEVMNEDNIGEELTVKGTVEESIKIGELSGFILADNTDKIGVSSDSIPAEGEEVVVRGYVRKNPIFGYYIEATQVK